MEAKDYVELDEMKREFYKKKEWQEKMGSYLKDPSVQGFMKLGDIKPPKIMNDYDLIENIYDKLYDRKYGAIFYNATEIQFNLGLIYLRDEDTFYESCGLIGESWANEVRERLKSFSGSNEYIGHKIYIPMRGSIYYTNEPKGFQFPSQYEDTKDISNFNEMSCKTYEYMEKYSIAKYQLLLMLMEKDYQDVVAYYNNPDNYKAIEDKVDRHILSLKNKESKNE
jgi:hypothetical protein